MLLLQAASASTSEIMASVRVTTVTAISLGWSLGYHPAAWHQPPMATLCVYHCCSLIEEHAESPIFNLWHLSVGLGPLPEALE